MAWKETNEGGIFLPQTATTVEAHNIEDYMDIASQALMEVMYMFVRGEDPMREIVVSTPSDREDSPNSQASPLLSPIATLPSYSVSTLTLPSGSKLAQPKSFLYLLDCYTRVAVEERNHPKVGNQFCSLDVKTLCKIPSRKRKKTFHQRNKRI